MNEATQQQDRCPYCRGTGCLIATGRVPRPCPWCVDETGIPTGRIENRDGELEKQDSDD